MNEIALAGINSFAHVAQQDHVPTTEPIFVLSSTQLQDIIKEATQPLHDEVESLKATITNLEAKVSALESTELKDVDRICFDIAFDRQRIAKLEDPGPGKTALSRAEKIEKYLQARPDHRATLETLKGHLGIDNDLLGKAIRSLKTSRRCAIIRTPGDKRKRSLVLLPR